MDRPKLQLLQRLGTMLAALFLGLLFLQACSDSSPTSATNSLITSTAKANNSSTPTNSSTASNSSQNKVDSVLLDLLLQYKLKGESAALDFAHQRGLLDANNNVIFSLVLNTTDTGPITTKIQSMGGTVRVTYQNMLTVAVPLDTVINYVTNDQARANFFQSLATFSEVKEIRFIPPPSPAMSFSGPQLKALLAQTAIFGPDQGVHTIAADAAQQHGFSGQNMKLGLIDAGFKDYQQFKDYLPASFTLKDFTVYNGPYSTIHGTASAIAMHQVAPAAQIFAAPVDSWEGFCNALDWFSQTIKVKVVAAVIGWNGFGRGDGTGTLEECINKAQVAGTLVVIAAGNDAYSHYGATLNPVQGYHKFANNTNRMKLRTDAGGQLEVILNWDDWEATPQVDLDLYLLDAQGQIVASSRNVQASGKPPWEYIDFVAKPGDTYYVQVKINNAPRNVNLNIFAANAAAHLEFPVAAGSVAVPADAAGALTVGATEWYNDVLASYSGQGPTTDGRIKPEITGPTDVINAAYGTEDGGTFGGTSAATPHVAAAALLVLQAHPEYTAESLYKALIANAKPLGKTVPNNQTGYGRVDLRFLLSLSASKPTIAPAVSPKATALSQPTKLPTATALPSPTLSIATPTTATTTEVISTPTVAPTATATPRPVATATATPLPTSAVTAAPQFVATATPLPTATPTARLAPPTSAASQISSIFHDDFNDTTSGLPDNLAGNHINSIKAGYQNGSYVIQTDSAVLSWVNYPAKLNGNFSAQVKITLPISASFGGLIFWQSDANNYYSLLFDDHAQWELAQLKAGQWFILKSWANSNNLKLGKIGNFVQLETQGTDVKISFNGELAARIKIAEPPTLKDWTMGLAAGSYGSSDSPTASVGVYFNDFILTNFDK